MLLDLLISEAVFEKLQVKHTVTRSEIEECFYNRSKGLLEDTREQHKTDPATVWFIARTDRGRQLKVVFIEAINGYEIKTAYEPNHIGVKIYEKYA